MQRFAGAANWNLEQSYETGARKVKRQKKEKEPKRLPIKTAKGIVHAQLDEDSTEDEAGSEDEEEKDGKGDMEGDKGEGDDVVEKMKELEMKPKIPEKQRVLEAKEELAKIAFAIQEDPEENITMTKRMRELTEDHNPTIQRLALAALMSVYKDVIPGFRIRPLTEQELKIKVSKDVQKLRDFEQSLVSGYQRFVEKLGKLVKAGRVQDTPAAKATGRVAVNCACQLLEAVPHFNFRGELLKIMAQILSVRTVDEGFERARKTLEEIFRTDEDGKVSFDAVQTLTKMFKAKHYRVHESVLNTFLSLRLLSELDARASMETVDGESRKRKKKDREFRTKKARKLEKEKKEVEKDMKEADATVSYEERERIQSETLKLVFVTYFKILKERPPGLMAATLEGLAKFSHLINLDFFGDLLVALKELIAEATEELESEDDTTDEDTRNATREALLCTITAFALLQGQGDKMLAVDLAFFTNHLYSTLLPLCLNADIEFSHKSLRLPDPDAPFEPTRVNVATQIEMVIRALDALFFKQNGATNVLRMAAFTKRLLLTSMHMPEKSALAISGVVGKLGKKYNRQLAGLFSTEESVGDGVYLMESEEPERSNPFAATIWETVLLEKHYCPAVQEAVKGLSKNFSVRKSNK
ncbi:nucleolar complex-associated protein-domain-containing protein [Pyronema domesticum]|uniref:Nucleolar complex-associated protein 3 n=1 Tax=Pyronema omphalodes (strain CBS 100304) TaxID=1076935 RepID=U4L9A0_PYROM|nr:nucleolar complex-associated protein-domain-containing protein [Pyronema domesticum]CCX15572.1 Similar to Nucleolar complex-associated protein 3; acc. no. Q07896 [Pyronema omphalodes CBS 100304]